MDTNEEIRVQESANVDDEESGPSGRIRISIVDLENMIVERSSKVNPQINAE